MRLRGFHIDIPKLLHVMDLDCSMIGQKTRDVYEKTF